MTEIGEAEYLAEPEAWERHAAAYKRTIYVIGPDGEPIYKLAPSADF